MPVEVLVLEPGREHLRVLHPIPQGFNKLSNGITRCINQMMYFMLRRGYLTYSAMPNDEREL
ncbi:unnamed protein product [Eruca vesicaria subsp. sativa]|uniref:Uncharacterized protein n=1 Tax=Eruca vesicaria subsp. sativa TaxID=29727 RepID=A0ABC8LMV6_ERUVS|nr:unnamed protein product [Eruca vesicaria subsp. sativa]